MASVIKKYPIGPSRLSRAALEGFSFADDGVMTAAEEGRRIFFLGGFDSNRRDCPWGRFRFRAEHTGDAVTVVRAFASDDTNHPEKQQSYDSLLLNPDYTVPEKLKLFEEARCSRFMAVSDMLLYGQKGRYLWISVEVVGTGCAVLSNIEVFSPQDNFLGTFPEIYRENADFFHRYLSVFSSLYYDIQEVIDSLDSYVDIDQTPKDSLPILADWLGLEFDFLDEKVMRALLKDAFGFLRKKGTRETVEGILNIILNVPYYIIEQHATAGNGAEKRIPERLYGSSSHDLTVLIQRPADERLHAELVFLLRQFIPMRVRLNIVFSEPHSRLDRYSYMDINACTANPRTGALDGTVGLDGLTFMH
jgi:phage tail-like protein